VGQRQSVEIVRSLLNDPKILILDEPTSVLTPDEIKNLFKIISNLVQDNLTVIFISHKLEEIINLSKRVTILREER
jgi:simple sugar transport system ATP-binding protein